jgi:alpha-1,6-mannosyltransferase
VLGLPGGTFATLLRSGMKYAAIGLVLLLMFRGDYSRAVRRMALAFTAVVMLSPIIQPWYILWFLPFLAVTGIRDDWQIRSLYVGVTFFVVFGAQDQLSVWSFVELPIDASSLAFVTALAFTFYLLFLDVHTRKLLIEARPLDLAKRGWGRLLNWRTARQSARRLG